MNKQIISILMMILLSSCMGCLQEESVVEEESVVDENDEVKPVANFENMTKSELYDKGSKIEKLDLCCGIDYFEINGDKYMFKGDTVNLVNILDNQEERVLKTKAYNYNIKDKDIIIGNSIVGSRKMCAGYIFIHNSTYDAIVFYHNSRTLNDNNIMNPYADPLTFYLNITLG